MILALVDVTGGNTTGEKPAPLPDYIYFSVSDLEAVYERARELQCLSTEDVHGDSAGRRKSPWGERYFYGTTRGEPDSACSGRSSHGIFCNRKRIPPHVASSTTSPDGENTSRAIFEAPPR